MRKMISIILSLCCVLSLAACTKVPDTEPLALTLVDTAVIENNEIINNSVLTLLPEDNVDQYVEEHDLDIEEIDNFRLMIVETSIPLYKIEIATLENGSFVYRNIDYNIPVSAGDGWFAFQIPGSCSEYKIFSYQQN